MHLPDGTLLQGGKYRIVHFISSGGFGCTYEAVHTLFDLRVAIKELFISDFCNRNPATGSVSLISQSRAELVGKLRKKFVEEARSVFKMQHPNIIRVIDIFEENGTAYYAMDYVEGHSLHEEVKQRGSLPESEAVGYVRQVADALRYVHSLNRLHLDIKPGNIMLDRKGNAVLIDFGASKHYDEESGENTSTLLGVNTKGYAPVEQQNSSFTTFSPATDIYALGATLYKLLTGITPPEAVRLLAEEETLPPLPTTISPMVRSAVSAAMQLKRKNRPQSVDDFLALLTGQPVVALVGEGAPLADLHEGYTASTINGHEYVDLGLSVKWATSNIGASSPSDYGYYFAWGEKTRKLNYDEETSVTYGRDMGDLTGNSRHDPARAIWAGTWRLPTETEIAELTNHCKWTWTQQSGKLGYRITGPNGNNIFLPAAGFRSGTSLFYVGEYGYYWSSSPYEYGMQNAYRLQFNKQTFGKGWIYRHYGLNIRPVSD
ncbi:MAG: protein kinase [Prevotellaceae bacterium]|nr:protein kinase [Prevotellaceae bacterium]